MSEPSMKGVVPWHQTNWDWRAAGNFIGGGSGTGLLFAAALAGGEAYRWLALAALGFVGAGLACVWMEIGKPWRALNVFRHPQTSWMTREGLVAPFLFMAGLAAAYAGGGAAAWLAAALAMLFLYCQGRILFAAKGIPAWRQSRIVPLVIATGLTEGAGWLALATGLTGIDGSRWLGGVLLLLCLARYWLWKQYLTQLRDGGAPRPALAVLDALDLRFVLLANGLPAALAVVSAAVGSGALLALAGLIAALGGWWLKYTLVTRAAFNQGFALPRLPVRGVGMPAAGVKPGWAPPQAKADTAATGQRPRTNLRNA